MNGNFKKIVVISLIWLVLPCSVNAKGDYGLFNKQYFSKNSTGDKKHIFIFFDGTDNSENSRTNIWKIFELLKAEKNKNLSIIYFPGVGSLMQKPISGKLLGRGMEERINAGAAFLSTHYDEGDTISIFGFSRGAHQARALAGYISYAGILSITDDVPEAMKQTHLGIELLKKQVESQEVLNGWRGWTAPQTTMFSENLQKRLKVNSQRVDINFLGLWDTVPGSSLKKYGQCKEERGFIKRYFSWLPAIDKGHRYKVDTYPTIKYAAHAVSIDENRSKFKPLLMCPPLNVGLSKVEEVWFPGAHSDVGGGYGDSDSMLSDISLVWMIEKFESNIFSLSNKYESVASHEGLAHWPIGDKSGFGSDCIDRILPASAKIHDTFKDRENLNKAKIRFYEQVEEKSYPLKCKDDR